jgi:hypothetical protein
MTIPEWAPGPDQVAAYVTSRTVDLEGTPGTDTPTGAFTTTTTPTAGQVDRVIEDACSWVTMVTGPIDATLQDAAAGVAALRAAGIVEMSYPERNADVDQSVNALLLQAKFARDELAAANRATGATSPNMSATPQYAFPDPCPWIGNDPVRYPRSPYVW